jgi:hypothetical protein
MPYGNVNKGNAVSKVNILLLSENNDLAHYLHPNYNCLYTNDILTFWETLPNQNILFISDTFFQQLPPQSLEKIRQQVPTLAVVLLTTPESKIRSSDAYFLGIDEILPRTNIDEQSITETLTKITAHQQEQALMLLFFPIENIQTTSYLQHTSQSQLSTLKEWINEKTFLHRHQGKKFFLGFLEISSDQTALIQKIELRIDKLSRKDVIFMPYAENQYVVLFLNVDASFRAFQSAHLIQQVLSAPVSIYLEEYTPRVDLGLSVYPDDSDNIFSLIDLAQQAAPANSVRFHHPVIRTEIEEELAMEKSLRTAFSKGAFRLSTKAIYQTSTKNIYALHVNMHWQDETGHWIESAAYQQTADKIGLLTSLIPWTLREIKKTIYTDSTPLSSLPLIYFTLPNHCFLKTNCAEYLLQVFEDGSLPPSQFILGIDADVIDTHKALVEKTLTALHALGFLFSLRCTSTNKTKQLLEWITPFHFTLIECDDNISFL